MTNLTRRAATAALALALAGAAVLASSPAHAGVTRNLKTGTVVYHGGHEAAQIQIDFTNKRSFDVQGWTEDLCPGDGYGAYLSVSYRVRRSSGQVETKPYRVFKDDNGCGNGTVPFDPAPGVLAKSDEVVALEFQLCGADPDHSGQSYAYPDGRCSDEQTVDNWRLK